LELGVMFFIASICLTHITEHIRTPRPPYL
jgi:hypothetical protein